MLPARALSAALAVTCAGFQATVVTAGYNWTITTTAAVAVAGPLDEESMVTVGGTCRAEGESAADRAAGEADRAVAATGPDLIFGDLQMTVRYGRLGDLTGYSVGTNTCNVGTERVDWIASSSRHPVLVQAAYRLKDGRFEQIGMSWATHGFYATSQSFCTPCNDPTNGTELGVGCSTSKLSAFLNGEQSNLSPRCDINAHTGAIAYPFDRTFEDTPIHKRLQIHDADLYPELNNGALYFIEAQSVAADDAAAGNADNNASYRRVRIHDIPPDTYYLVIDPTWQTQREQAAIRAWQDHDPEVVETDVRVPGEGLFILAAKATDLGDGFWHYEYALQNLNSDRSAGSFGVPLPYEAVVENIGFHDVDHHSGEPYDLTDWVPAVDGGYLTWSTDSCDVKPNANALRFGTLYDFWFDCDVEPATTTIMLGLFKPGTPSEVTASTIGPWLGFIDCNGNLIPDTCDIDCSSPGCEPPCGTSDDCDGNWVPNECEPDCNENGIADPCDIIDCPPGEHWCFDCNKNDLLDGCELPGDFDEDDAVDLGDVGPFIAFMAGPEDQHSPTCALADMDGDGDVDLADFAEFQAALGE